MSDAIETDHQGDVASELYNALKARLGDAWTKLSIEDHDLIVAVVNDAAALQLQTLATPRNTPAYTAIKEEVKQLNAQLLNIASVKAADLQAAFWDGFKFVAGKLIDVAFTAAIAAA